MTFLTASINLVKTWDSSERGGVVLKATGGAEERIRPTAVE